VTPKRVFVTTGPNQVEEGFYTVDGSKITMTYANGENVMLHETEPVTATAEPHMIEAVARALTRKIRKLALGESVPGFGRGETIGTNPAPDGFGRTLNYEREIFA
jgi:hypothetical protein